MKYLYNYKANKINTNIIMKKLFSLAIVMLVAAISVNASAQESKLVGKWSVDTSQVMDTSAMGDVKLALRFDADNEGELRALFTLNEPVEAGVSLYVEMAINADLEWALSGDVLAMQSTDVNLYIKKIEVSPSRPEYEAILPQLKEMLQQQFEAEKESMIEGFEGLVKVRFIDNDRMVLTNDSGDDLRCKRIR